MGSLLNDTAEYEPGQLRHSRSGAVYLITKDGSWRRLPPEAEVEARERFKRKQHEQTVKQVEVKMEIEKARSPRDVAMSVETKKRNDGLIVHVVKLTHKPTGRVFEEWSATFDDAKERAQAKLDEALDLDDAEREAVR